jgi:hypothetical protein
MGDPRAVADRYVEIAVADGKDELTTLLAEDCVFVAPDGQTYHGREEIGGFYRRQLANIVPTFHIHDAVVEGNRCWIELANDTPDGPMLVASLHFVVDDAGMITRLASFPRFLAR